MEVIRWVITSSFGGDKLENKDKVTLPGVSLRLASARRGGQPHLPNGVLPIGWAVFHPSGTLYLRALDYSWVSPWHSLYRKTQVSKTRPGPPTRTFNGRLTVPAPDFSPGKRVFKPARTLRYIN
jgi:hypothetical protein